MCSLPSPGRCGLGCWRFESSEKPGCFSPSWTTAGLFSHRWNTDTAAEAWFRDRHCRSCPQRFLLMAWCWSTVIHSWPAVAFPAWRCCCCPMRSLRSRHSWLSEQCRGHPCTHCSLPGCSRWAWFRHSWSWWVSIALASRLTTQARWCPTGCRATIQAPVQLQECGRQWDFPSPSPHRGEEWMRKWPKTVSQYPVL